MFEGRPHPRTRNFGDGLSDFHTDTHTHTQTRIPSHAGVRTHIRYVRARTNARTGEVAGGTSQRGRGRTGVRSALTSITRSAVSVHFLLSRTRHPRARTAPAPRLFHSSLAAPEPPEGSGIRSASQSPSPAHSLVTVQRPRKSVHRQSGSRRRFRYGTFRYLRLPLFGTIMVATLIIAGF